MNENISKWGAIIGGIVILFLIISAFIIMNTVELAISSQRLIIRSMQLVGATPWFIKRPFLWQSLKNALLSSTIAWLSISLILYFNQQSLADIIQILLDGGGFWKLGALLITLSVVVGVFSTYITVSRFVRAKLHQMYLCRSLMESGLYRENNSRKYILPNKERMKRYSCQMLTIDEDFEVVFEIEQTSLFSLPE